MSDKEHFSFHYCLDGTGVLHEKNYELGVSPAEVYKDFLYWLNTVYGWDTEGYIAALYRDSVD